MRQPTIAAKDNGYFEIWNLPCGHRVSIPTSGYSGVSREARARLRKRDRARLSCPGICPTCKHEAGE